MNDKIQATHLERRAIVYLRQSTLQQVHDNHESTLRQYALGQRAIELGWPSARVDVIDDDLGRSGTTTEGRTGFQRLANDVAHGQIGAIFALEVSRLARSSADWHRLLDLCGLADVVIVDEQTVYTPRDPNDRLLLGLKGTMSDAEQYWMRLRLTGGRLNKARRGELHITPPTGYVWDGAAARFRLDPDEAVQQAVRLVFERFCIDGSARGDAVSRASGAPDTGTRQSHRDRALERSVSLRDSQHATQSRLRWGLCLWTS
jgi:DNA invertase Pin-like site-specific DNA recombinase